MKKIAVLILLIFVGFSGFSATLWSQDFATGTTGFFTTSGMTRNAGGTYACTSSDYVYYAAASTAYFETTTINVPQSRGIKLSFDSRRANSSAGDIKIYYLITGSCAFSTASVTTNGWVLWGTITPNTNAGSNIGCTNQFLQLSNDICGGQNIAVVMAFPSTSSGATDWIAVDNLLIEDIAPTVAVPNIAGATTYLENFTTDKWYGPVTTGNYATAGVVIPYHTYKDASTAYTYLWSNGSNGTANHAGVPADYYAGFYSGFEFCNNTGGTQIITKELNTSGCATPEVKYAWRSEYPCSGGANYDNTFDENYKSYAPYLYTSTGQGYTWTQQPVNYYFPDGLWHFATYSVPQSANIKLRFARRSSCTSPVEGIDHIKVLCRDCSISALTAGAITGEAAPMVNTDYTYTIAPTAGATYYKWMVRANDRTPPVIFEAACPNGSDPCIVSGQGTLSAVINFGSLAQNYRVICIPYDANPGTLAAPSDACYAALAYFPAASTLPIELNYFKIVQMEEGVQLQWQTLTETNNDYFTIEQSLDAIYYSEIGRIDGAGNSNQKLNYSFDVEKLHSGTNYFRLTQVDFDGSTTHSEALSVINESPEESIRIISANGQLIIESGLDVLYPLSMQVFDVMGRQVFATNNILMGAGASQSYDLPAISEGLYFIRLNGIGVKIRQSIFIGR